MKPIPAGALFAGCALSIMAGAVHAQTCPPSRLTHQSPSSFDNFGASVALRGDTLVVGAPQDEVGANSRQGSVTVFRKGMGGWTQEAILTAGDGAAFDYFGACVALAQSPSGAMTVMVGAREWGGNNGKVYAFVRASGSTVWAQTDAFRNTNNTLNEFFGSSVAFVDDSTVVVGATGVRIGVNSNVGAAFVFTRTSTTGIWTQRAQLIASDGAADDYFGATVVGLTDTVIVGAPNDDVSGRADQGSAYVFTRDPGGTAWTQQTRITSPEGAAGDRFGGASASGSRFLAGGGGRAEVYIRTGASWEREAVLQSGDGTPLGPGRIDGDLLVVRDWVYPIPSPLPARVFARVPGTPTWTQQRAMNAPGATGSFAEALALSDGTLVAGSRSDHLPAVSWAGSVWVFDDIVTRCCDGIDFNQDTLFADTGDIDDFLMVFSGGPCSTGSCADIDFNNDGLMPDTMDIDAFLSVFSGGPCL